MNSFSSYNNIMKLLILLSVVLILIIFLVFYYVCKYMYEHTNVKIINIAYPIEKRYKNFH